MILETIPGSKIQNPSRNQIIFALEQAYSGLVNAVILSVDSDINNFIQIAGGTQHIEYREGGGSPIFAADDIPLAQCVDIFNDFADGGSHWKDSAQWQSFLAVDKRGRLNKPYKGTGKEESAGQKVQDHASARSLPAGWRLKPGRIALTVLAGFMLPCGLCWFSVFLSQQLEPSEFSRFLADMNYTIVWLSCAGISWAMLHTEVNGVRWNRTFLFVILGLSIPFFIGELWISYAFMGITSAAFISASLCGISTLYFIIRLIRISMEFEQDSLETPGINLSVGCLNDAEVQGVNYEFLDKYRDQHRVSSFGTIEKYKTALAEKRLRVYVRYLQRNPYLHSARIEILDP